MRLGPPALAIGRRLDDVNEYHQLIMASSISIRSDDYRIARSLSLVSWMEFHGTFRQLSHPFVLLLRGISFPTDSTLQCILDKKRKHSKKSLPRFVFFILAWFGIIFFATKTKRKLGY
jgi:hypothetical protein